MAGNDPKNSQPNFHVGHRKRLQARFLQEGLTHFNDHQALELLLFQVIPRADTNPIAHQLIDTFGSFSAVLDASIMDLQKITGIGKKAALFIHTLAPLTQKYFYDKVQQQKLLLDHPEKVSAYLKPLLATRVAESFYVLCLDSQCGVIAAIELSQGVVNETAVYPRKVVEIALQHHATSIIIAHNHPSGNAKPSGADRRLTTQLFALMQMIQIPLLDHMIIAGDESYSFANHSELV